MTKLGYPSNAADRPGGVDENGVDRSLVTAVMAAAIGDVEKHRVAGLCNRYVLLGACLSERGMMRETRAGFMQAWEEVEAELRRFLTVARIQEAGRKDDGDE